MSEILLTLSKIFLTLSFNWYAHEIIMLPDGTFNCKLRSMVINIQISIVSSNRSCKLIKMADSFFDDSLWWSTGSQPKMDFMYTDKHDRRRMSTRRTRINTNKKNKKTTRNQGAVSFRWLDDIPAEVRQIIYEHPFAGNFHRVHSLPSHSPV